jgi:hypothetical protein
METAGAGEEDSSDEETRDNLMEVDPDQDRKYLALFLSVFRIRIHLIRIRIRIPHFKLKTDPDPERIRSQDFDDQKLKKKFKAEKKIWIKTTIFLSLGLYKGRPSYRRSLQPSKVKIEHPALQNMIFFFVGQFCTPGFGIRIWIWIH